MYKKILLYIIVLLFISAGWKIADERSDINACRELRDRLEFNVINVQLKLYKMKFEITKLDFSDGDNKYPIPKAEGETAYGKYANDITNDLNIIGKQVNIIGQKNSCEKQFV